MRSLAIYSESINVDSGGGFTYLFSLIKSLAGTYEIFLVISDFGQAKLIPVEIEQYCKIKIIDNIFFKRKFIGQFLHAGYDFFNFDIIVFKSNHIPRLNFIKKSYILVDFPFEKELNLIKKIRLSTYHEILCNSYYTQRWIKKWWKRESCVLYPPADMDIKNLDKKNIILSVGRFIKNGRSKRQDILIEAFQQLYDEGEVNYELYLVGFIADEIFFEELVNKSKGYPVKFFPDVTVEAVQELYGSSKFYWHACGYGSDVLANPSAAEHYGISVVDALSAGCLTFVYGVGGPAEIIQNNENGFLWYSKDELVSKTKFLINEYSLENEVKNNALKSSSIYSMQSFQERIKKIF